MYASEKVAVVTIHGVGDPKPGTTAAAVAKLLVAREGFRHEREAPWLVRVRTVPSGHVTADADQAIHFHDGLVRGTRLPHQDEVYEARRHELHDGDSTRVDVIEVHWGDLSGLTGTATRVISEMYTLGLRFSQLGRDAVRQVAAAAAPCRRGHALKALGIVQQATACTLTLPVVLLNAVLLLASLWWITIAATLGDPLRHAAVLGALAVAAVATLLVCLSFGGGTRRKWLATGATALFAAFAWWGEKESEAWAQALAALVLAAMFVAAYLRFLRFYDTLVPGARATGLALAALLVLLLPVAFERRADAARWMAADRAGVFPSATVAFVTAHMLEIVLLLLLVSWAMLALTLAASAVLGCYVRRGEPERSEVMRAIDTGRFGLFLSVSLFLLLTVGAWLVIQGPLTQAFGQHEYLSLLAKSPLRGETIQKVGAAHFSDAVRGLVWTLALVAVLVFLATTVLLPSVWVELRPPRPGADGGALGEWLTETGRRFAVILSGIAFWSALAVVLVMLFRVGRIAGMDPGWLTQPPPVGLSYLTGFLSTIGDGAADLPSRWTASIFAASAGSAVGLISVASRLFATLSRLRVPVDIALDVDNHFRDFPAHATPRGRIGARLYSVLCAVRDAGYDRIVIVAHSQGTVIVADLLRYLRKACPGWRLRMPEMRLFTCGSPLRQLYASRFPALYRWVEQPVSGLGLGPQAGALGVTRWTNAYCTGDYVGRWLWQTASQPPRPILAEVRAGKEHYRQVCLGAGAHTHYYDLQMAPVAAELHALIR